MAGTTSLRSALTVQTLGVSRRTRGSEQVRLSTPTLVGARQRDHQIIDSNERRY